MRAAIRRWLGIPDQPQALQLKIGDSDIEKAIKAAVEIGRAAWAHPPQIFSEAIKAAVEIGRAAWAHPPQIFSEAIKAAVEIGRAAWAHPPQIFSEPIVGQVEQASDEPQPQEPEPPSTKVPDFELVSDGDLIPVRARARSSGAEMIAAERRRQVEEEGYDRNHDLQHVHDELVLAALYYAWPEDATSVGTTATSLKAIRPDWFFPTAWDERYRKRPGTEKIRRLTIAGALLAAEIDLELSRDHSRRTEDPRRSVRPQNLYGPEAEK